MKVFNILLSRVLFFIIILQHSDALVPSWHEFKSSVTIEIGILHSHPFTNCCFPLWLVWNRRAPKCCFIGPTKLCVTRRGLFRTAVQLDMRMSDTRFVSGALVGTCGSSTLSLKQHLGGRRFYDNEEVVIAFREWLRMQDAGFYRDWIFKPTKIG